MYIDILKVMAVLSCMLHKDPARTAQWTLRLGYKNQSMIYREIIADSSEIHTNKLGGQNVQSLNVKLAVHIVTTGL